MSLDQVSITPSAPRAASPARSGPFVSHAQNFEDVMLWRALRTVANGRYIDVGAGEPDADSVTLAFYERGWQGVNVEPLLGPFTRLQAARPRDVNLNMAAGAIGGEVCLYVVGDESGLSTLDPALAARHRADNWTVTEKPTRVATLAEICAAHDDGSDLHFLKIDAEGAELDVLRGADLTRWRPWIILLEAVDPVEQKPQHEAWETEVLTPAGYGCVWFDGLNRFYLAAEHEAALAHAFRAPANVFDDFVRVAEVKLRNQLEGRSHAAQGRIDEAQARVEEEQALLLAAQAHSAEAVVGRAAAEAGHAAAKAEIAALREDLARTVLERNGWAQELFESNRYAADLTITRQSLLEELERLRVHEAWRVLQVADYEAQIAACKAHETDLVAGMAQARVREDQLLQEMVSLRTLEARHRKILAEATHDRLWLDAVEKSSSWRVTRPMRATLRLLGRKGRN